jgi:hypothetical protein
MYQHTILEPKTLYFEPEYRTCPHCHKRIQKHIVCNGARWHVHRWDSNGTHCSEQDCEDNHGIGKCTETLRDKHGNKYEAIR